MILTTLKAGLIAVSLSLAQVAAGAPSITICDNTVVCIDPGHGGDNSGAIYDGLYEKDQNLLIALAMKEELLKYSGITVVLTRDTDTTLTLSERSQIARDKGARLLISLHLNASGTHTQHGTEVWASASKDQYGEAKAFGNIVLADLTAGLGTERRAVKTRLGSSGRSDYYGVIRTAESYQIPCVIIEHCYMDNPKDDGLWETEEACRKIGKIDATAVAKCFGLRSPEHDFTNFHRIVKVPEEDWVTSRYDKRKSPAAAEPPAACSGLHAASESRTKQPDSK